MKLLTANTGWAATKHEIFWTTDDGNHWKDITPPYVPRTEILSVFFLNESDGWVVWNRRDKTSNEVSAFSLASTHNAGTDWEVNAVRISDVDPHIVGGARMFFLDTRHGWINFGSGGSAMSGGFIIATADGGKTWNHTRGGSEFEAGGRGPVVFTSSKEGWFSNGIELFVTHDGADTWQRVSLKPPPEAGAAVNASYDIPIFQGKGHGFLSVTFSSPNSGANPGSVLVAFRTQDSGKTWKVDRILPNLQETSQDLPVPSTMTESMLVVVAEPVAGHSSLAKVSGDGKNRAIKRDWLRYLGTEFFEPAPRLGYKRNEPTDADHRRRGYLDRYHAANDGKRA
jgi:photosystem II stability/assembly factor-like uncharacterized protein